MAALDDSPKAVFRIKTAQKSFSFSAVALPRTLLGELRRCPRPPSPLGREIPPPHYPSPLTHSASRCPVRFFKYDHLAILDLCNGQVSVHPSVCLSHRSTAVAACDQFVNVIEYFGDADFAPLACCARGQLHSLSPISYATQVRTLKQLCNASSLAQSC